MKIHGDFAPVSSNTSLGMLNFGLLDDPEALDMKAHAILACAAGSDNFETWSTCFKECAEKVNELEESKVLNIDGVDHRIQLFLGVLFVFQL